MKRNLVIVLFLILTVASVAYAVPVSDSGNPHNMSGLPSTTGVKAVAPAYPGESVADQICVFCHTPHSTSSKSTLWSRPDPNNMGSFPVYGQPLKINQDAGAIALTGYDAGSLEYPSGATRMCLSCHDGTTSIGILLDNTVITMEGSQTVTNDTIQGIVELDTSHPVSFNYNQNVINYIDPPNTSYQLPDGTVDVPLDGSGQMQCTTCHDPHEDTRADVAYDFLPFWRHPGNLTSYDDVCDACHVAAPISGSLPHTLP